MEQANLISLQHVVEERGSLTVAEVGQHVPFEVKRCFLVSGVPVGQTRGSHAHRSCEQVLVAASGAITATVTNERGTSTFELTDPSVGLFVPTLHWGGQTYNTSDAVLLVLCSEHYDPAEYITDPSELRLPTRDERDV